MATTIKLKNGSGAPTAGDLVQGEPALDLTNKRLYTEDSGGTVIEVGTNPTSVTTGDITATGTATFAGLTTTADVSFGDNDKAVFGAGSDLQIYHNGSNSYIDDAGTGSLVIRSNAVNIGKYTGETAAVFTADGSVQLRYDNSAKFETTATGIDVTGTVTADGLTVDGTATISGAATAGFVTPLLAKNPSTNAASSVKIGLDAGGTTWGEIGASYNTNDPYMAFFVRSGSEKVRITDAGNVGIGTDSPNFPLQINAASGNIVGVFENTTGNTNRLYLGAESTVSYIDATAGVGATNLAFKVASTERMRIDSSGRVGIGTSSPATTLTVEGSGANGLELNRNGADATQSARLFFDSSTSGYAVTNVAGALTFNSGATAGSSSGTERMRIDANGKVGIGTTPSHPFHVVAADGTLALFSNGVDADLNIKTASAVTLLTPSTGTLAFGTSNTERMRIDSSGNLLVGTTDTTLYNNTTGNGFMVFGSGGVHVAKESSGATDPALLLNNTGDDGQVIRIAKDGSTVGSIGVTGGDLMIGQGAVGVRFLDSSPSLYPTNITSGATADASIDIGTGAARFKDLYLSGKVHLQYPGNSYYAKVEVDSSTNLILGAGPNGAEAARIDSSGNLLVGASSTFTTGDLNSGGTGGILVATNTGNLPCLTLKMAGDNGAVARFIRGGTSSPVGSIVVTGSGTTYNTTSDQRLKDNIVDAPSASSDIDAIQVRSFDWKADGSHQKYGMVAQELQNVAPEAVSGDADSEDMMGVDYSKLVPMMLKEIQSLRARVAQLEGEN